MTKGSYSVTGRILIDCDGQPFANRLIQLVHYTSTAVCSSATPETATDDLGFFTFFYDEDCTDFSFSDEYQVVIADGKGSGKVLLTRIPGKTNAAVGTIFADNKTQVYVLVEPIGVISQKDTLYFGNGVTETYTIFPIKSVGGIYHFTTTPQLFENKNNSSVFYYGIGYNAYQAAIAAPGINNSMPYTDAGCDAIADTAIIKLQ